MCACRNKAFRFWLCRESVSIIMVYVPDQFLLPDRHPRHKICMHWGLCIHTANNDICLVFAYIIFRTFHNEVSYYLNSQNVVPALPPHPLPHHTPYEMVNLQPTARQRETLISFDSNLRLPLGTKLHTCIGIKSTAAGYIYLLHEIIKPLYQYS